MSHTLYEYHPVIGYRFVPGVRARVRHEGGGYLVSCNRRGFRSDRDPDAPPRAGETRVFLFGDSYTAGEGVSNPHRFGEHLERRVPGIAIHNFGLPGSGTDQQYLAWRELAREVPHDVLLLCPMVENVRRNVDRHRLTQSSSDGRLVLRAKPYFTLEGERLALNHTPVPKGALPPRARPDGAAPSNASASAGGALALARSAVRLVDRRLPGFRAFTQRVRRIRWPEEYERADHPSWRLMRAILATWVRESGKPVLLCPIPTFDHIAGNVLADGYRARFGELSRDLAVPWVDLLPALQRHPPDVRRRLRFPHDEHPTPLGHEVLADAIAPHLARFTQRELAA